MSERHLAAVEEEPLSDTEAELHVEDNGVFRELAKERLFPIISISDHKGPMYEVQVMRDGDVPQLPIFWEFVPTPVPGNPRYHSRVYNPDRIWRARTFWTARLRGWWLTWRARRQFIRRCKAANKIANW